MRTILVMGGCPVDVGFGITAAHARMVVDTHQHISIVLFVLPYGRNKQ
jgi:hypothetical protein